VPLRDVPGHRRIVELLSRSVSRSTLPPSLIFCGPAGAGKRQTAVALAQAVNCLSPRDGDACGACASCTRIARGVHPDIIIVEPGDSGAIKIDQIRDVVDRASYRPFEGKRRVVIVDDADVMVAAAQNALLKTLEEPPPGSIFVLVTSRPDMLLITVRSRCIRLAFMAGSQPDIDVDARDVAEQVLAHVAAAGSSRDAQRLDGAKTLLAKTGRSGALDREQVTGHLKSMASLLRDMAVVSTGAADDLIANRDARDVVDRLASAYHGERGVRAYAAIDEAIAAINANVGVKVVADWIVLQL
jgi:DNA polymerase-3 subunit delta'